MSIQKKTVVLIVLDGWGHRDDIKDNAIKQATTPFFNSIWNKYPHSLLQASGKFVGLPDGQMGNSEIGHTTIGAGNIIDTDLVRIDKAIENGDFEKNPVINSLFDYVKKNNSILHVQGLLSDGGVHSHEEHLFAFLKAAKKAGVKKVAIHVFTDGRDNSPTGSIKSMDKLNKVLEEVGNAFVATISGRYFAMDRDNNWDRLEKAEKAMFECVGNVCKINPTAMIDTIHKTGKSDEHIEPIVCLDYEGKGCAIEKNDAVFFYNFRSDRARMLTKKIIDKGIFMATMTKYGTEFNVPVAFPDIKIETTIAKEIAEVGMSQSHIAETEKFPHATYFLNGGVEKLYPNEKHILLDSRKDVKTHDLAPKMRAEGIAEKAIEEIKSGVDFIFINFANPDMVGHTANVPAIIEALEEVDKQLKRVIDVLEENNGIAFITADHGNAEQNKDSEGNPHTSHTINPVPAIFIDFFDKERKLSLRDGGLSDIAPTILFLLGIKQPLSMKGKVLCN